MRKAGVPESVNGPFNEGMYLRYDTVDDTDMRNAVDRFGGYLKRVDQNVDQTPSKAQRVDPSLSQPLDPSHGAEAGT